MKRDEGYIKFNAIWEKTAALPFSEIQHLDHWRSEMYRHGLIGAYPDGIGFGNISQRTTGTNGHFHITGSATGLRPKLSTEDYTTVTSFDIPKNTVHCSGPIIASSESMSHAVIYHQLDWVNGVIHIHHAGLWKKLLHRVPTTDSSATYGTPEMARSIIHLLENTDLPEKKIFVMEGHEEGVFSFGKTLEEAANLILKCLEDKILSI